jgi:hypothetical protein
MIIMSLVLFIGIIGVVLVLLFKRPLIERLGENNRLVGKLKHARWFQNHWLAGIFLFVMNGFLFFITCLVLYGLMYFLIPFVHLFVMLFAVIVSILLWLVLNKSWQGTKSNRLKMSMVGSSFYLFLTFIFVYLYVTLEPSYPGEDTFMRAIGLMFSIIVAIVAFITCFVITGFTKKKGMV